MKHTDPTLVRELDKFKTVTNAGRKLQKGHTTTNVDEAMQKLDSHRFRNFPQVSSRNWVDELITMPFMPELAVETTQEDQLGFAMDLLNEFEYFDDSGNGYVSPSDALKIYIGFNNKFKVSYFHL